MSKQQEQEILVWISSILGRTVGNGNLHEALKDGVVLCELVKKITGKASKFPKMSKAAFIQMENICYFIDSARELGVPDAENFQTIDLFEEKNMTQVMYCLSSLSRHLYKAGKTTSIIGPKLAEEIKITFTDEQIKDAKRAVNLQYGYVMPDCKSKSLNK
ncbi:transgelin [Enteropsectra breve]|nr:transgelin [Enteropsectra breve]